MQLSVASKLRKDFISESHAIFHAIQKQHELQEALPHPKLPAECFMPPHFFKFPLHFEELESSFLTTPCTSRKEFYGGRKLCFYTLAVAARFDGDKVTDFADCSHTFVISRIRPTVTTKVASIKRFNLPVNGGVTLFVEAFRSGRTISIPFGQETLHAC